MEYHSNKDSGVAIRIFELGLKQFSDDVEYVVRYLQFLLSINDDSSEFLSARSEIGPHFRRSGFIRAICEQNPHRQSPAAMGRMGEVRVPLW